jgi:hypothetical protein
MLKAFSGKKVKFISVPKNERPVHDKNSKTTTDGQYRAHNFSLTFLLLKNQPF